MKEKRARAASLKHTFLDQLHATFCSICNVGISTHKTHLNKNINLFLPLTIPPLPEKPVSLQNAQ
jgi:hypothetical protein